MKRIRLRAMVSLLAEKFYRNTFHAIESLSNFKKSKAALLEKMPLPRRKKWWEKLAEHHQDHFYQEGNELLPTVPSKFHAVYRLIIE